MDLLSGAKKVILAMEHTANGTKKILEKCTLPLTAAGQVNLIITEMAVMEIKENRIILKERNNEYSIQEIQDNTEAKLVIDPELKIMQF